MIIGAKTGNWQHTHMRKCLRMLKTLLNLSEYIIMHLFNDSWEAGVDSKLLKMKRDMMIVS